MEGARTKHIEFLYLHRSGEYEEYIELGFAECIEELLLLVQGKVWQILKDGYMRYES